MSLIFTDICIVVIFFFEQKTAYKVRISDWSSDVCSSDLRYTARWKADRRKDAGDGVTAFIPLTFKPGEAYQFDWSHEDVEIAGKPMRVKVAHMRLCASRAVYVRAYPRESQEMLFDAHARGFAFFGGVQIGRAHV